MTKSIEIFHKNKPPALQTLEGIKPILSKYEDQYEISYYDIDDPKNIPLTEKAGLPKAHCPFAIVINGKFSAKIDDKIIDFLFFPDYMSIMERHLGNWSKESFEKVLADNNLLSDENCFNKEKADSDHDCGCH